MSRSTIKDPAKSKSSETFFKVLRFIGRYRFLLIFSIILAAVSVILQLYVPILFGNAIDQVIAQHQVNFEMMWYYLSRILVMVILSSAATWLMNVINNRMTYQTVKDIRAKAIRHIQVLPLSYLDGHSTGDIISRIIADTDILSDGMLLGFTQLFSGIVNETSLTPADVPHNRMSRVKNKSYLHHRKYDFRNPGDRYGGHHKGRRPSSG